MRVFFSLLFGLAIVPLFAKPTPQQTAFFENRVRPILVEHCYECHSEQAGKQKGDLLLDRPSGWLEGGTSGPALIPGNLEESLISFAISHEDEDAAMPPKEKLPIGKINVLNRWIQMGAPGPKKVLKESDFSRLGDQDYLTEKAKSHWAFQPVTRPTLPGKSGNPIDRFIIEGLNDKALSLNPPADRRTILRRLSYDLIGLPPTLEEVENYIADESPEAYTKQVDRLLASPHFGERWGRYWLDIARYADTREWQAAGRDSRYPFAYTYRDWVINSINNDMPYDEFIRYQVAADFYTESDQDPNLAALGFLTVGSRFRNNQDEIANDRIDVVTRGVMGLTVACARCHDHKYDPIPTSDYYALHGVFLSSKDITTYPVIGESKGATPEQKSDYAQQIAVATKAREDYKNDLATEAIKDFKKRPAEYLPVLYDMSIARTTNVQKLISGNKYKEHTLTPIGRKLDRVRVEKTYLNDPIWRPFRLLIKHKAPRSFTDAFVAYIEDENEHSKIDPAILEFLARKPYPKNAREFSGRYGMAFEKALATSQAPKYQALAAVVNDPNGIFSISPEEALNASRISGKGRTAIAKLDNAVRSIDAEHPAAPMRAMIVEETDKPYNPRIYNRGERTNRGDSVKRRWLTALGANEFDPETSGRKQLAESITDPEVNPFTTRAAVNRTWMQLFGSPLISTPGDMGLQSDPPTHPEMLDWMAHQFVKDNWSIKKLVRRIVLSKTYRQSTGTRADGESRDPENQLYWRANIRRLDFEAMRDSILMAANNLDKTMGGRAVEITAPPYSNRRTVYAHIDRVNLDNLFATFDFPSPIQSSPKRPQTMVPQQALFAMNDDFTILQARKLSEVIRETTEGKVFQGRVTNLYERVFQRKPTPQEIKIAFEYFNKAQDGLTIENQTGWQYGFGNPDVKGKVADRFKAFPYFDSRRNAYQFSKAYPHPKMRHLALTSTGGHPGRDSSLASVRRWIAPYPGKFKIRAEVVHNNPNGDGIRGRLFSSKQGLLRNTHVHNTKKGINFPELELEKGEILDFTIDCRETPVADGYRLTIDITRVGDSEYDEPGMVTTWDSQSDFSGPPPPPLSKWQQLAHALIQTNEFLFID